MYQLSPSTFPYSNYVIDNKDDQFKHVNDLPPLFKFIVYKILAIPHFNPDLLAEFEEDSSTHSS